MKLSITAGLVPALWLLNPAMAQTVCSDGTVCDGLKFGPGGYHPCSTKTSKDCMPLGDSPSSAFVWTTSPGIQHVPYCDQGWVLVDVDSGAKRCAPVSQLKMPKETP